MLSLWKSNLHIEPEIQENSNLIALTRLILSIFFPTPASFQLPPCSNLCPYSVECTLTSIFCFSYLLFLLASSLLSSLSLCLSGSQFDMCSAGYNLIPFQPSTLPVSAFWTIFMLQDISKKQTHFCFLFYAAFCFRLLSVAAACCCLLLCLLTALAWKYWIRNVGPGARGQGVPFLLSTGECLVFWHDTLVSCHQCHRSA